MTLGHAHMLLEWRVVPGQAPSITAALHGVMLATRREAGCLGSVMCTSTSDGVTVRYVEDWDTEERLRQQLRSDRFRTIATLIEAATEPPRIEFVLPGGTRGLEYATEVRDVESRRVNGIESGSA